MVTQIDRVALTTNRLCYPGKVIELDCVGHRVTTIISALDRHHIWVSDRVSSGPCDCFVVYLGERFRAFGTVVAALSNSVLVLESEFEVLNARAAPRIAVVMDGIYYLRPPTLGVPLRIFDISISGLAMMPLEGETPLPGQRRLIAFEVEGREVRTVIEFVSIDRQLWRARFLKLALSDEDAIARFVMSCQVDRRRSLSDLEIRTPSSLDIAARWRYPLIEEVVVDHTELTLSARGTTVTLLVPAPLDGDRSTLDGLVGRLRLGDFRDVSHYLSLLDLRESSRDVVLLACLAASSQLQDCPLAQTLGAIVDGVDRPECTSTVVMTGFTPGATSFTDDAGHRWSLVAHSTGIGVYQQAMTARVRLESQWVDPSILAKVASAEYGLLVAPWYDRWPLTGLVKELAFAIAGLHPKGSVLVTANPE